MSESISSGFHYEDESQWHEDLSLQEDGRESGSYATGESLGRTEDHGGGVEHFTEQAAPIPEPEAAAQEGGPIISEEGWKREYSRLQEKVGEMGRSLVNEGKDPLKDTDYNFLLGQLNGARLQVVAHSAENAIRHLFEQDS